MINLATTHNKDLRTIEVLDKPKSPLKSILVNKNNSKDKPVSVRIFIQNMISASTFYIKI